jgi:hypothetical protein
MHKIRKTKKNLYNKNQGNGGKQSGGGGEPPIDLQSLTPEQIDALLQQGITPDQLAQFALEQGQPVPPLVQQMIDAQGAAPQPGMEQAMAPPMDQQAMMAQGMEQPGMAPPPSKTSAFPAQMDLPTYAQYKSVEKEEKKRLGAHKPNVYGYVFSDLISEDILRDMKKTQGSFLVGVNLSNLFNEFRSMIKDDERQKKSSKLTNSEDIFKRVGEYVNVDFEKILDKKMGYRGSDVPLLPEQELTENSSFYEVIHESKKYADMGYNGKITPFGLLIMTRMLYKYRKNNAQWIRVATILELIYKYFGNGQNRVDFFKNRDEISIMSLMDLEEFYNTDHIFMTEEELHKFKKDLDFYKYDPKINIQKQIKELLSKAPPII